MTKKHSENNGWKFQHTLIPPTLTEEICLINAGLLWKHGAVIASQALLKFSRLYRRKNGN